MRRCKSIYRGVHVKKLQIHDVVIFFAVIIAKRFECHRGLIPIKLCEMYRIDLTPNVRADAM